MTPKRILFFSPFVNRGITRLMCEKVLASLANAGEERGWQFDILGRLWDDYGDEVTYPPGLAFEATEPIKPLPAYPELYRHLPTLSSRFVDQLRLCAPGYDLIFCPNAFWSTAQVWDVKTPLVSLVSDLSWDFVEMSSFLNLYLSESLCRIAETSVCTVFTAEVHRQLALRRYGFDMQDTELIPSSADLYADPYLGGENAARSLKLRYGLPERYLLLPDAVDYGGIEIALLAYARCQHKTDQSIPPLVVCGEKTHEIQASSTLYGSRLSRFILETLGLEVGTSVLFHTESLPFERSTLFAGAIATLVPARVAGDVSGSIMTAAQSRSPLIFSDWQTFVDRLGRDERFGLTFPVDDAEALSDKIIQLLNLPDEARSRAAQAFAWAQQYRMPQMIDRYIQLFERMMKNERE